MSILLKGKQWVGHCGQRARERYRKRELLIAAKLAKEIYGIEVDHDGRTPAGLIVPGAEPRREDQP